MTDPPDRTIDRAESEAYTRARELVLKYGWNSTCFQIVNPGIEYWFGDDGDSVVGYVTSGQNKQRFRTLRLRLCNFIMP